MRRGYATLFAAVLLVTFFVNPSVAPPAPRSASPQTEAHTHVIRPLAVQSGSKVAAPQRNFPKSPKSLCQDDTLMCPEAGLLNTIQAAFGPDRDLSHWNVPKEDRKHIRFIIATVPDPAHTRLSYMFDRQIDAIQEAVQTSNYLFARSWMPWDSADHPESDDFRIRLGQKAFQNAMESHPGLMIFRKARSANDPIANASQRNPVFVLIVGESPTEGINKDQFRKAIEIE